MKNMTERHYIFAQDLTRLRIAETVLKEVIHGDFEAYTKEIVRRLRSMIDAAYDSFDLDTTDSKVQP